MTDFHLDWETRCVLDLDEVGLDVYLAHPSARIIMANYAWGDRNVQRWEPHLNPQLPAELESALLDPFCTIHAWGAEFERSVAWKLLGINKPASEWRCAMAQARSLSLPGKLKEAGAILKLGEKSKLRTGDDLIRLFCVPADLGGKETLWGLSDPLFNDWSTHPREWALFCEYGGQDVVAERAAENRMKRFPMPESEQETWCLDQKINDTGWPVDHTTVEGARAIVLRELEPLNNRIQELSGISNPNSPPQIKTWLSTQGYDFTSIGKDFVARALGGECDLTPAAREVLELRGQTAKSSVSKYTALADMTSADGRLRHQYTFYGAHSGRWAAHGANVGNFPKPSKEVDKRLDRAIELVRLMDYDGIVREFGKPLEVASSVLRSAFRAPDGKKFVVADLNAIENRGLGYLARCESILKVFRTMVTIDGITEPMDPYIQFGTRMYDLPYETIWREAHAGDKHKRNICKAPVLGGGYALGPGKEDRDENGNVVWTGLMGYARKMGVEITQEESKLSIQVLRDSWPEVKNLWKDMERASSFAIRHPGRTIGVGVPQTQWEKESFERAHRKIYDPRVSFLCHSNKILEMLLPSRRSLFFIDPRVEEEDREYEGRKYKQDVVYHKAKDQKTRQWAEISTFGGRWVENACQAISRDVLVNGMKLSDTKGFEIVGHTYDEIVSLAPVDGDLGIKELCECMTAPPSWCGEEFPLAASGFEDSVYRKD